MTELQDLGPGDAAYVSRWHYSGHAYEQARVERVTKTLIILTSGARFNRSTGRGAKGSGRQVHAQTPELTRRYLQQQEALKFERLVYALDKARKAASPRPIIDTGPPHELKAVNVMLRKALGALGCYNG